MRRLLRRFLCLFLAGLFPPFPAPAEETAAPSVQTRLSVQLPLPEPYPLAFSEQPTEIDRVTLMPNNCLAVVNDVQGGTEESVEYRVDYFGADGVPLCCQRTLMNFDTPQ